jgi:fatty acid amide hydrolase 2
MVASMAEHRASTRLFEMSALELAALVRAKEVSSREVVDAHIARIELVNPLINALANDRFDEARREAREADERIARASPSDALPRLLGVPCTIKEFFAVRGLRHTAGLVRLRDRVATEDAITVARLREAGAIVLGNTNVPEGGLWLETHNLVYGRTNNPWDLRRTSGGSSGGEGAIIAAGGSPFGLGSDIGGSIRYPSAFCGVVGHKPSGRLVPNSGQFPAPGGTASAYLSSGPMARRVSDLFPLLRILAGPDPGDPAARPFELGDPSAVRLRDLTVVLLDEHPATRISAPMKHAVHAAAKALEDQGARVERLDLPELRWGLEIWATMLEEASPVQYDDLLGGDEGVSYLREIALLPFGRSRHSGPAIVMGLGNRVLSRLDRGKEKLVAMGLELRRRIEDALGDHGVLLSPPYNRTAPLHHDAWRTPFAGACSAIFNVLELPSTVVPTGFDEIGLPTSVQIVGARGADHVTIAAAHVVEAELGGFVLATPQAPKRRSLFGFA